MIRRWLIIAPLITVLGLGLCAGLQRKVDSQRPELPAYDPTDPNFDSDLLYVPNDKLLSHFTGGMSTVVADLLWLKCVQYTAKHFRGDGKFVWLEHMARTITRLDPYFVPVYRHTGIFLAALKGDDESSIRLMESGIVQNPQAWELPYEIAMVYLLNRRDDPLAPEMAGKYLGLAVAMGTAPESVGEIAQGLMMQHSLNDLERDMWQGVLAKSDDKFERAMAERKLAELALRENCEALNKAVALYRQAQSRPPARIEDLYNAGLINGIPVDPLGGAYFFDSDGAVKNTTLLDDSIKRRAERIQAGIRRYRQDNGAFPPSLDALVETGYFQRLPAHPYNDRTWHYDPATGEVS